MSDETDKPIFLRPRVGVDAAFSRLDGEQLDVAQAAARAMNVAGGDSDELRRPEREERPSKPSCDRIGSRDRRARPSAPGRVADRDA
jgi:hypothetical protein